MGLAVLQTLWRRRKRVSEPHNKPGPQNLPLDTNFQKKNVPSWMRSSFIACTCRWVKKGSWAPSKWLLEGSKRNKWIKHTRTKKLQNTTSCSEDLRSTKSFWKWNIEWGDRGGERIVRDRGTDKVRNRDCSHVGKSVPEDTDIRNVQAAP